MIKIGVIGLGYWGPNLLRNFANMPNVKISALCDRDKGVLDNVSKKFPDAVASVEAEEIMDREIIDAVVIATSTKTHYSLARIALEKNLHAFVEKPLATNPEECEHLIKLATQKGLVLLVGHVFLYTAAVRKLKELVLDGSLGNISHISSSRLNLGPVRQDVNALWDLTPHDISMMIYLIGESPIAVNCQGLAHLNKKVHDVCLLSLHFKNNAMGIINVSWLDPNKTRLMTIVGDKKMAVYNDIEPLEKIKIYDKGVNAPKHSDSYGDFQFSYRYGDTYSPMLNDTEPLKNECQAFIECVKNGKKLLTDGKNGLEVVKVLHAADISLHSGGGRVEIETAC
jgi:predicted dehydrogenase